jgi:hypothetical protein
VCGELEAVSKWLDYQIRRITKQVPTYLGDSQEALVSLRAMGELLINARLFTSDAMAMYTNIEPAVGIATVKTWVSEYESELPKGFPSRIIIELVLTRNTFQFDDTFWQKIIGTAMGTPHACVYATVVYGYHERTKITSRISKQVLPYLKRFIDAMLGIWCGTDEELELFKASLDGFCKLDWITSDMASQVTFLDLVISIDPSSRHIMTKHTKNHRIFTYTFLLLQHTLKPVSKAQSWATSSGTGKKFQSGRLQNAALKNRR